MRIERLEIDGFGRFHAVAWDFREGLTVLLGANEAGKTTLLNALRALLFGFEATRDGRTWYPALAGGRRGGRLVLRTHGGERWTVERHGDRGGSGSLVVRAPNGNQGGQETLDRLLHGADRDLFTNIFAFGLGELQTFASLSADGVRGRIYGAGAGLGGTSALDLERRLRQQMDEVFLPRGRERPLNQLMARIEALRGEIADLGRQPQEHAEAHRARTELRARAAELRETLRAERERATRLAGLLEARRPAAELSILDEELAAGDAALDELPADSVAVLDRHVGLVGEARSALEAVEVELGAVRKDRQALSPDAAILSAAEQIAAVREEAVSRAGAPDRRRELESAVARHAHTVDEQVGRAGVLAEPALLDLDDSIGAVERTREMERSLAAARRAVEEAERRVRVLSDEVEARERESVPVADDLEAAAGRRMALDELDALRIRRAVAEAQAPAAADRAAPAAAAALGLAAVVVGIAVGQPVVGGVLGVAVAVAGWLVLRGRGPAARHDIGALEIERRTLLERAGLPADADDAAVRRVAAELATHRARATLAADNRAALEARRRELLGSERDLERAGASLAEAEAAWSAWLLASRLPDGLSPEVVRQVLAAAGAARRAAVERDEHRRRLEALTAEEDAYASRVEGVARLLEAPQPDGPAARDAFVVGLAERLAAAREDERRAADLEAMVERLEQRRATAAVGLAERETALSAFLAAATCTDPDALRARDREAAARRATSARRRELRATLAGMAGGAEAVDRLVAEAMAGDPAEIEAACMDAREQIERLDEEEREVLNRIGALDARIAQLERADELGVRRQELAALEGRAGAMAREWSVRALALRLLTETRSRYERERQPDVVRAATEHFERITDGRYARIVAPPGEHGVRIETAGGEARTTDELSRGTAEQLYLALRFGLIEEFARGAEPLPVVMDDILVNFDVDRAARAAAAVGDLAGRHQVLYFTCHRHAAELLDPGGSRTLSLD